MLVFAGCDNAAAGGSKPTGRDDGNPPPVSDDPRNAVLGTYNNVIIDGIEYTLTFYEGGLGVIKKSASSGNMRAIMPDVPAEGADFVWTLSGNTVIIMALVGDQIDSFTLDFNNASGIKKLSNLQVVPAATYEWDEATKTLTFKGPGEINYRWFSRLDNNERQELSNKVEKIVIQDGVTIIGMRAIEPMNSLKSVTIPDSVAIIWPGAFIGDSELLGSSSPTKLTKLTSLTLPDNTDVFGGAFSTCVELTDITVGSGHKYFTAENGILYNKDKTKLIAWPAASGTVSIPSTVTYISPFAFFGSTSLTSVTIPSGVTEIGDRAFSQCMSLTSVTISNSVTSIGKAAFNMCYRLSNVTIPNSVTSIGSYAFAQCVSLTSVAIPNSVTSIGSAAFFYCKSLTSVTIPNSVTSIEASAFRECTSLTSVTIPDSVVSIEEGAFNQCRELPSVVIPGSVTEIGRGAFSLCDELASIIVEATTPPKLGTDAFKALPMNNVERKIYVPSASVSAYKTAAGWSEYASVIEPIPAS